MKSRGLPMPQKAPVSLPFTQAPTPSIPFTQASTPSIPFTQAPTLPVPSLPVTPSLLSTQAPTLPMPSLPFTQAPTLPMPSLPLTSSLPFTQASTLPMASLPVTPSLPSTQDSTLDLETHLPPPKIPTVPSIPLKIPLPPKIPTVPSPAPKTPLKLPMPPKTSPPPMPSKKIPLPPTPKSSQSQHFPLSRTPSVTAFSLIQSTPEAEGDAPFPSPPPIPSIPPSTPSIQVAKPSIKLPPPPVIPSTVVSKPPSAPSIQVAKPSIKLPPPPVLKPPSVPSIPLKKSQSDDELFSPISSPVGSPKGIYPLVKAPYNPISSIKDFFEDEEEKEERLRKKKEKEDKKKEEEEAEKKRKKEEEKNRLSNLYKESMDAYRREKTEKEREDEERRKFLEGERQKYIISRQMHYKELSNVPWPYLLEKNKKDDSYMTEKQKEIFKVFDHVGWNMDFDSDSIMYVEERKEKSYSYKYDPYIDFMESPVEFRRAFREGKIIEEKNNEEGEQQWITLRLLFDGNKYVDVFWYSSKGITPEKIIDLTSEFYNTPLSYENIKNIYTDEPVSDKNDYYGKLPKNMLSKTHQTEFVGFIPLPNWVFLIKFNIL